MGSGRSWEDVLNKTEKATVASFSDKSKNHAGAYGAGRSPGLENGSRKAGQRLLSQNRNEELGLPDDLAVRM
jgi:hypothetical protein